MINTRIMSSLNPLNSSRGLFLSLYGSAAMFFPFLAVYFEGRGLTGKEIGLLVAIPPAVSILAGPLWGAAADASGSHRRLMRLALAGSLLLILPLPFASGLLFSGLLLGLHAAFFMSLPAFVDHTALQNLGDRPEGYGRLRMWGSIGWGLSGLLLAPVLARYGLAWIFFGHAAALALGLLATLGLPAGRARPASPQPARRPSPVLAMRRFAGGFRPLFADRRWQAFLLLIFTAGFGNAVGGHFLFLYLGSLSAGPALMGLTLSMGVLSELVMLALAGRLQRRFGAPRLLLLATAGLAAQLLAWSLITSPQVAIVVYVLKGFAFATLWAAAVAYAGEIAPPGLAATAQGLLSSMFFGLSSAAGALLGGLGYELAGPAGLFRWTALGMLAVLLAVQAIQRRRIARPAPAVDPLPC